MKKIIGFCFAFLICSCSENPEVYLEHLNGYWEIDEVVLSNGLKRDYKFNNTIDFIEVSDSLNGFRKKLKPIKVDCEIKIGDEIKYNDLIIGKILIDKPVPFALIKLFEPEFSLIKDQKLKINNSEVQLI